jgi:hypothetical protein
MTKPGLDAPVDPDKLKIGDPGFCRAWGAKLLFTLISVKVWGLLAGTWVSTYLVVASKITDVHWVTFNTTVWGLIFGMKEVFKIAEGRDKTEKRLAEQQSEADERITALKLNHVQIPRLTPDGLEIVGNEPD